MAQWYYARNGQQAGPVSLEDLKQLAARKQLQPNDLVFQVGTPNWVAASTVAGLFAGVAIVPPVPGTGQVAEVEPIDDEPGDNIVVRLWHSLSWHVNRMPVSQPEARQLQKLGISDPTVQRYLVWRRTLLMIVIGLTAVGALLGTVTHLHTLINFHEEANASLKITHPGAKVSISGLGMFIDAITILGQFAMPLMALLAVLNWSRPRMSYRMIVVGWAIAFLLPLLLGLVPLRWRFTLLGMSLEEQVGFYLGRGLVLALGSLIMLITIMLSLIGGAVAGSLRVKSLMPGSVVPGWFLLGAGSLQALVIFVVFVTINYVATAGWLLLAIGCYLAALLVYLVNWKTFVRPLPEKDCDQRMGRARLFNLSSQTAGTTIFLVYLFTTKIGTMSLAGFEKGKCVVTFWNLLELYLGYFGRLLFITVLAFDLLTRINLSVWTAPTKFAGTSELQHYEEALTALDETLKRD